MTHTTNPFGSKKTEIYKLHHRPIQAEPIFKIMASSNQLETPNITGTPNPFVTEAINRGNEVVFFDVVMGGDDKGGVGSELGRIKLELFVKDVS